MVPIACDAATVNTSLPRGSSGKDARRLALDASWFPKHVMQLSVGSMPFRRTTLGDGTFRGEGEREVGRHGSH